MHFIAADHFDSPFHEEEKQFQRLILKFDPCSISEEALPAEIQFEWSKSEFLRRSDRTLHRSSLSQRCSETGKRITIRYQFQLISERSSLSAEVC